ncbi:uncharacterized protein LOC144644837 [Oculina patagonica]
MEALLDNWLKNSHIPLEKNTSDEFVDQLHPSKAVPLPPEEKMEVELPELPSEMLRTKTQLHSQCRENDDIYLVCGSAIERLFLYLTEEHSLICHCRERFDFSTFKVGRVTKNNHCCKVVVECMAKEKHTLEWFSSSIISGKYYVNLRMVHGFTSAGLIPSQYESLCQGAKLGYLNEHYIADVYEGSRYREAVEMMVEYSFAEEIEDVKQDVAYDDEGTGVMVDGRHDSARTAYHTTVTAISMGSHKVLGVANCSREEIRSAESREKPMTLELVDRLKGEEGLNITEVSHDTVVGIKNELRSRGISNSFDTWHGGKGVKKAITKIAKGTLKTEGKVWFTDLSDKVKSIKTHFYYSMKNCEGDPNKLRTSLTNIVEHYKGNHRHCHQESRCKTQGDYVPTKRIIKNPEAAEALLKAIKGTSVYKYAEDFAKCRDTYYIESFHNCLLIYVPKRIHFGDKVYNMRVYLACLDWNENVDRDVYTTKQYQSIKRPDRVAPFRVLKPKTYFFKDNIWATFFTFNW